MGTAVIDVACDDAALVRRALAGDEAAREAIVVRLMPIIQHRVGRVLARFRSARGQGLERGDVLDLMQQMLLLLFDDGARVLATWDATRGLSLENFVGLVATREAQAVLRSGRRSAWAEMPTAEDVLDTWHAVSIDDQVLAIRDELTRIWHALEGQLSPRGLALFGALFVEEQPVEAVCEAFQMSATAVYNFRSRLRIKVREIREVVSPSSSRACETPPGHRLAASLSSAAARRVR